jgi:hypothetical protein
MKESREGSEADIRDGEEPMKWSTEERVALRETMLQILGANVLKRMKEEGTETPDQPEEGWVSGKTGNAWKKE